jgi:hypothetical protein
MVLRAHAWDAQSAAKRYEPKRMQCRAFESEMLVPVPILVDKREAVIAKRRSQLHTGACAAPAPTLPRVATTRAELQLQRASTIRASAVVPRLTVSIQAAAAAHSPSLAAQPDPVAVAISIVAAIHRARFTYARQGLTLLVDAL